jgi:hypothetical protein
MLLWWYLLHELKEPFEDIAKLLDQRFWHHSDGSVVHRGFLQYLLVPFLLSPLFILLLTEDREGEV